MAARLALLALILPLVASAGCSKDKAAPAPAEASEPSPPKHAPPPPTAKRVDDPAAVEPGAPAAAKAPEVVDAAKAAVDAEGPAPDVGPSAPVGKAPAAPAAPEAALAEVMARRVPVAAWVDEAIGGATSPEADPTLFFRALAKQEAQAALYAKRQGPIRKRSRALVTDGAKARIAVRPLAAEFEAADLLVVALDAAEVRLHGKGGLPDPLAGQPVGGELMGLGVVLGGRAADALVAGRHEAARAWIQREARYAALIAHDARAYQELAAGVVLAQEALGLLEELLRREAGAEPPPDHHERAAELRRLRQKLGEYGAVLSRARAAMRDPRWLPWWRWAARWHPRRLWRYEAVEALAAIARGAPDAKAPTDAAPVARAALEELAKGASSAAPTARRLLETLAVEGK